MRSRLLPVVLSLVVLVLLGLGIPLALSLANGEQQRMFLDRLTITERLASLAQNLVLNGQDEPHMRKVLQRYQEVYGVSSTMVDRDGTPLVSSPTAPAVTDASIAARLGEALAGRQPEPPSLFLPWDSRPMLLAEPVMADGEVRGAVLTVSPTDALGEKVLVQWAFVLAGGVVALVLATLLALPVVQWILRPIRRLDEAAGRVAEVAVQGGTPPQAALRSGPPELRKLAESFDSMATSVTELLAAQRAFVADASHQLRNPLTALNLRLQNLDEMVAEEALSDYEAARTEARRLNDVLDALLTLARREAMSGAPVTIDASDALSERVAAWRPVAAARDVELRADIPDGLSVHAVPHAVDGILDALLDNALKFSEGHVPADGDASVEVSAYRTGAMVAIAVRDHGPGVEPEELDRITDRFWRSPRQQNVAGSGLGMAIVAQIAERSAGRLRLDLPEGGGLRITVELPAQPLV
ncbi:HAMP domain-containing sensor histidine kinase [Amycolatopsis cynarae]|uniref:histidine kinase n=1 Tax=Amycolatopsis cynarae TaxID=2995223 RepID=A0ABY7B5P6_9PSEU|nr:HAMP domain-containing sensor histidine kinase [Amycolatopsis sp. HUAS 11-8]WAL66508.1 HAMP domain-containing sensor histidine kinase [Amycolatopsis sp. HUAS 11-8]